MRFSGSPPGDRFPDGKKFPTAGGTQNTDRKEATEISGGLPGGKGRVLLQLGARVVRQQRLEYRWIDIVVGIVSTVRTDLLCETCAPTRQNVPPLAMILRYLILPESASSCESPFFWDDGSPMGLVLELGNTRFRGRRMGILGGHKPA